MNRSDPYWSETDAATSANEGFDDDDDGWLSNASDFSRRSRSDRPGPRPQAPQSQSGSGQARRLFRIPAVADGVAELRSIADSFEHRHSTDLRYPFSERAEWSRLASSELQSVADEGRLASVAFLHHAQLRQRVEESQAPQAATSRLLSFDHKQARHDGGRLAWPLEADQEVEAIISRRHAALASVRKQILADHGARTRPSSRKRRRRNRQATDDAKGAENINADEPSPATGRHDEGLGSDSDAEAVSELVDPVLLAVQQQLRRTYEHLMLQETSWSNAGSRRKKRSPRGNAPESADAPKDKVPKIKAKTGKRPFDWRSVVGFLSQRSESISTGADREMAFDTALRATAERLEQIYGTASLHLLKGRPTASQHYVKAGDSASRRAMLDNALARAEDSLRPRRGEADEPPRREAESRENLPTRYLMDASLLDPTDLLVDYEATAKLRPPPGDQDREVRPLPGRSDEPTGRPTFTRQDGRVIGSSAGPLLLARRPIDRRRVKEVLNPGGSRSAVLHSASGSDAGSSASDRRSSVSSSSSDDPSSSSDDADGSSDSDSDSDPRPSRRSKKAKTGRNTPQRAVRKSSAPWRGRSESRSLDASHEEHDRGAGASSASASAAQGEAAAAAARPSHQSSAGTGAKKAKRRTLITAVGGVGTGLKRRGMVRASSGF
ncbi:uncharacterized protein PFL1_00744 [Pseudozyma flocculosa PF-1]|uniref:uncharacterized protein n=1 Tax=Pseudozyma flocculosa PF-1 TaxID=1277687 RepID=UPI00045606FD|nr:uncharacterized protein PFL1_00744 [Pseudozyma flocculosa PF-1]EPQ31409.1 hypothetical protein PFL1_00744 [Pseudozyma flocculosa PF-1]